MQVISSVAPVPNHPVSTTDSQIASLLKLDTHYTKEGNRLSERQLQELLANPQANLETLNSVLRLTQSLGRDICEFCDCVARMINQAPENEQNRAFEIIAKDNLELAYQVGSAACQVNSVIQKVLMYQQHQANLVEGDR